MNGIIILYIMIIATLNTIHGKRKNMILLKQARDLQIKYPYIVGLIRNNITRVCTGSLISPEWVLTAANSLDNTINIIQYGDLTVEPQESKTTSEIIRRVPHPGYRHLEGEVCSNDIALCYVNHVAIRKYGRPSAMDYISFTGRAVMYSGLRKSQESEENVKLRSSFEGVVIKCTAIFDQFADITLGPYLCVAPKCTNFNDNLGRGESGGPLLCDGKIIGVVTGGPDKPSIGVYTALSPFLTWIEEQMLPQNNSRITRNFKDKT